MFSNSPAPAVLAKRASRGLRHPALSQQHHLDALALRRWYLPSQRSLQPPHLGLAAFDHPFPRIRWFKRITPQARDTARSFLPNRPDSRRYGGGISALIALQRVGRHEFRIDIRRGISDFLFQGGIRKTERRGHIYTSASQGRRVLLGAERAVPLGSMNAVFDPEVDKSRAGGVTRRRSCCT